METPNVSTRHGGYLLGLIWGCGTVCGDRFLFRHKDISALEDIKKGLHLSTKIFYVKQRGVLKISRQAYVLELLAWLDSLGWARRQAQSRPYPEGVINDEGFIFGWCSMHARFDTKKTPKGRCPRIRIYGNVALLQKINERIAELVELPLMKPQKTTNEITKVLYYQGATAETLQEWLNADGWRDGRTNGSAWCYLTITD